MTSSAMNAALLKRCGHKSSTRWPSRSRFRRVALSRRLRTRRPPHRRRNGEAPTHCGPARRARASDVVAAAAPSRTPRARSARCVRGARQRRAPRRSRATARPVRRGAGHARVEAVGAAAASARAAHHNFADAHSLTYATSILHHTHGHTLTRTHSHVHSHPRPHTPPGPRHTQVRPPSPQL